MDRLSCVVMPKSQTAAALLRAVDKLDWDPTFFLNLSSTSSLLGYPGQSKYSAANGFLDAMSAWGARDERFLILTVDWGPWGEVGMVKKGSKAYDNAVTDGDTPLLNKAALTALSHILRHGESRQFTVFDVNWDISRWKELAIVSELFDKKQLAPVAPSGLAATRAATKATMYSVADGPLTDKITQEEMLLKGFVAWHPKKHW